MILKATISTENMYLSSDHLKVFSLKLKTFTEQHSMIVFNFKGF